MGQNIIDTVNFSTVPVTYTQAHNLKDDDGNWHDTASFNPANVSTPNGGVGGQGGALRQGFTWTNDQWCQATMVLKPDHGMFLMLRFQTAANNGYVAGYNVDFGDGVHYYIYLSVAAAYTTVLAGPSTAVPTTGDVLNFQVVGNVCTLNINNGAEILTGSADNTYTTDNPGLWTRHDANTATKILSTWTAGSVTADVIGLPPVPAKRMVSVIYSQG